MQTQASLLSIGLDNKINVYSYPTALGNIALGSQHEVTLGDLHANLIKLIYQLIQCGIASLEKEKYEELVKLLKRDRELYQFLIVPTWIKSLQPPYSQEQLSFINNILLPTIKANPFLTKAIPTDSKYSPLTLDNLGKYFEDFQENINKNNLEEYKQELKKNLATYKLLLKDIKVINKDVFLRLIGDVLGDRIGPTDTHLLLLLKELELQGLQFKVIASNHDLESIQYRESNAFNPSKNPYVSGVQIDQAFSLQGTIFQVKNQIEDKQKIAELYDWYLDHLSPFDISMENKNKLNIFFHAPVGLAAIQALALYFELDELPFKIDEKGKLHIQSIEHFSKITKEIDARFEALLTSKTLGGEYTKSSETRSKSLKEKYHPNNKTLFFKDHKTPNELSDDARNLVSSIIDKITWERVREKPEEKYDIEYDMPPTIINDDPKATQTKINCNYFHGHDLIKKMQHHIFCIDNTAGKTFTGKEKEEASPIAITVDKEELTLSNQSSHSSFRFFRSGSESASLQHPIVSSSRGIYSDEANKLLSSFSTNIKILIKEIPDIIALFKKWKGYLATPNEHDVIITKLTVCSQKLSDFHSDLDDKSTKLNTSQQQTLKTLETEIKNLVNDLRVKFPKPTSLTNKK